LDFKGVLAISGPALALAGDSALGPKQLRNMLICSASASTALGDYVSALDGFSTVQSEMDRQAVIFDWYWRMPLAAGMTELWLATGDRRGSRCLWPPGEFTRPQLALMKNRGMSKPPFRTAISVASQSSGWPIRCQNKSRCERFSCRRPLLPGF
jgi:hypothetical protein